MDVVAGLLTREADRHMALTVLKAEGEWVPKSLCLAAEEHTGRLPFRCHDSRTFLLKERRGKCVCLWGLLSCDPLCAKEWHFWPDH
jgi:hypothetical protein